MPSGTDALLAIIAGRDTKGYFEVRTLPQPGPREWFPLRDRKRCIEYMADHAASADVYVGAAPRTSYGGGGVAHISHGWCVWADVDTPEAIGRLRSFSPRPSLTIRSGSGDHLHAYWALTEPLPVPWLRQAVQRLAVTLGADMNSTDPARILRPPGTLNHKSSPARPVTVEHVWKSPELLRVSIASVTKNLAPLPVKPPVRPRPDVVRTDDPLLGVSADRYYEILTGRQPTRGNVQCPFHGEGRERNPSMRLYDTTWYCFVCRAGGSVYQFGAHLYGMDRPRGEEFKRLRARLTDALV